MTDDLPVMAGGQTLPPDVAGLTFHEAMRRLHDLAGRPSTRIISLAIRRDRTLPDMCSHAAVARVLRGDSVPAWSRVYSIIAVLARMAATPYDRAHVAPVMQALWAEAQESDHPAAKAHHPNVKAIRATLIAARAQAGLSQWDVARTMRTVQSAVSDIELGGNPTLDTASRWAEAVGYELLVRPRPRRTPCHWALP